jgi:hypothetical protein
MLEKVQNIFTIPQEIAITFFITTEGEEEKVSWILLSFV